VDRFRDQLVRQLGFLKRSCSSYDAGFTDESIRIATCIRVLVHDTKFSTSLLTHLGAKNIQLLSTVPPIENLDRVFAFDGLTSFSANGPRPKLRRTVRDSALLVADWWEQIVYVMGQGQFFRRSDLVLAASNKDGGAHVDAKLTPDYEKLATDIWHRVDLDSGSDLPLPDVHLIGLRQLGYEILNSEELVNLVEQQP